MFIIVVTDRSSQKQIFMVGGCFLTKLNDAKNWTNHEKVIILLKKIGTHSTLITYIIWRFKRNFCHPVFWLDYFSLAPQATTCYDCNYIINIFICLVHIDTSDTYTFMGLGGVNWGPCWHMSPMGYFMNFQKRLEG